MIYIFFCMMRDIISKDAMHFKTVSVFLYCDYLSDHCFVLFLDKRVALFKLSDAESSRR